MIQRLSGMHNHKASKVEIKPTPIQRFNAANDQITIPTLRMVTGFVQSLIKLSGLDWTAPDYSTLCRRQKHIDIAISYQKVVMDCIYS